MNKTLYQPLIASIIYVPFADAQSLNIGNIKVVEVKSKTGRTWMDRNLGATQVGSSNTNSASLEIYTNGAGERMVIS